MENDTADAALTALAAELVETISAAKALELTAARQEVTAVGQEVTGAAPPRDTSGRFLPPPPDPAGAWAHTLRHPRNRGHLLENDAFLAQAYGRAAGPGRDAAAGAHWGAGTQDSQQQEASPAGVLPDSELDSRGLYEAARGTTEAGTDLPLQQPERPEGLPLRPARQRPRNRYGRRRTRGR